MAKHNVSLTVIIVSWNGKHYLEDCLKSLENQTFQDFNIILVDNGSMDGTASYVAENFPDVEIISQPNNTGFACPNTIAAARALSDPHVRYFVTLNNDTKADPHFLEEMVKAAEAAPGIGMVAAKMLNYFETNRLDSVGLEVSKNGLGYNVGVGKRDDGNYDTPTEIFGPCGGAALYKREIYEQVGFFDGDFFAYYEDFDLAWRSRLAGWHCITAPAAIVYHVHSGTSGESSVLKIYYTHRNKWFVIMKNWPTAVICYNLPRLLLYDLAALLLAVLRRRGWAALRARCAVLRYLPLLLRKRHAIQAHKVLDNAAVGQLFTCHENPWRTLARKLRQPGKRA